MSSDQGALRREPESPEAGSRNALTSVLRGGARAACSRLSRSRVSTPQAALHDRQPRALRRWHEALPGAGHPSANREGRMTPQPAPGAAVVERDRARSRAASAVTGAESPPPLLTKCQINSRGNFEHCSDRDSSAINTNRPRSDLTSSPLPGEHRSDRQLHGTPPRARSARRRRLGG